ncbi:MAG TPA: NlpC/P60 family protein [Acidimicrobiales bacterium]|nr:NlpC/P60 family protein [Acidimicrobiales bacterium]
MSYTQGMGSALAAMSQIQTEIASLQSGADFASVLGSVGSAPASTFGFPLEEGGPLPGSASYGTQSGSANQTSAGGQVGLLGLTSFGAPATSGLSVTGNAPGTLGDQAVTEAQSFLGVPYLWGGTNPSQGLDCSGLVQDVYEKLGIHLPRTSQEQALVGEAVSTVANAVPGDLVFYAGSDGTASAPGHVGIYIGNGKMIDAPYSGASVRVDPVGNPVAIRRVTGLAPGATTGVPGGPAAVAGLSQIQPSATNAVPADLQPIFDLAAAKYQVPPALLSSVASTESGFSPDAVSGAGAQGLMQLMPTTAASLGVDPFDPTQAVPAAARLLSSYHQEFGSWSLAVAAYNAGPEAVQRFGGVPPYSQTQSYVTKVMSGAGMGIDQ